MDAMELDTARQAIRSDKEYETVQRLQATYGKKFDSRTLTQNQKDIADLLGEAIGVTSIQKDLRQAKQQRGGYNNK